jgi:hypothetical protein
MTHVPLHSRSRQLESNRKQLVWLIFVDRLELEFNREVVSCVQWLPEGRDFLVLTCAII